MPLFPTTFAENVEILETDIGLRGNEALVRLQEKGFTVAMGLTEYFAGAVCTMGRQRSIREYCPDDATVSRFGTLDSTQEWLQRGRGMFLLLWGEEASAQLAGYGWTGFKPCSELPEHPVTSAYRIGERFQGKGLGKDFVQAVVSGTNAIYAPGQGIGLETWKSNPAASLYSKVGFLLLTEAREDEMRPTLAYVEQGMIMDRRLYMGYQSELLA